MGDVGKKISKKNADGTIEYDTPGAGAAIARGTDAVRNKFKGIKESLLGKPHSQTQRSKLDAPKDDNTYFQTGSKQDLADKAQNDAAVADKEMNQNFKKSQDATKNAIDRKNDPEDDVDVVIKLSALKKLRHKATVSGSGDLDEFQVQR